MPYVSDFAMFTVWLVSRMCDYDNQPAGCEDHSDGAFVGCVCMTELCNTGVQSVGHEVIVGCVTVTAVVGRIFYY